jgi:hypothetical protein
VDDTSRMAAQPSPGSVPAKGALDETAIRQTLMAVLDRVLPVAPDVEYRFVGTASAVLRGIRMPAGDLDILLKERQGVDRFAGAVSEMPSTTCLVPPTWEAEYRQYFARYLVDGVVVEFSTVESQTDSDAMECFGRGPWEHVELVPCGSHQVPSVSLELRLITELRRQRLERYQPIVAYLREHGCDVELLRRGMAARQVVDDLQEAILGQLAEVPA